MGVPSEDVVVVQQGKKADEPCLITVNCPDKTGLGSDLCRIILEFGLFITKAGFISLGFQISALLSHHIVLIFVVTWIFLISLFLLIWWCLFECNALISFSIQIQMYSFVCVVGISITDVSTDGKWCYVVFWVVPHSRSMRVSWTSLKKRLLSICPSCLIPFYFESATLPKPSQVYLLKFVSLNRRGLLHGNFEMSLIRSLEFNSYPTI